MDEREVLETAQAIRPYLPELVGDQADEVDRELNELLGQADAGKSVKIPILKVLRRHDATREWANKLLKVPLQDRSYERLPGRRQIPAVPMYGCPEGDGEPWYRFSVAEEIPRCPKHDVPFVPRAVS
jgi:hypothetical protein